MAKLPTVVDGKVVMKGGKVVMTSSGDQCCGCDSDCCEHTLEDGTTIIHCACNLLMVFPLLDVYLTIGPPPPPDEIFPPDDASFYGTFFCNVFPPRVIEFVCTGGLYLPIADNTLTRNDDGTMTLALVDIDDDELGSYNFGADDECPEDSEFPGTWTGVAGASPPDPTIEGLFAGSCVLDLSSLPATIDVDLTHLDPAGGEISPGSPACFTGAVSGIDPSLFFPGTGTLTLDPTTGVYTGTAGTFDPTGRGGPIGVTVYWSSAGVGPTVNYDVDEQNQLGGTLFCSWVMVVSVPLGVGSEVLFYINKSQNFPTLDVITDPTAAFDPRGNFDQYPRGLIVAGGTEEDCSSGIGEYNSHVTGFCFVTGTGITS